MSRFIVQGVDVFSVHLISLAKGSAHLLLVVLGCMLDVFGMGVVGKCCLADFIDFCIYRLVGGEVRYNFKGAVFVLAAGILFYWGVERNGYEGNMLGTIYRFFGGKGILLFFVALSLFALIGRREK